MTSASRAVLSVLCLAARLASGADPGGELSAQEIARRANAQGGLNLLGLTAQLKLITVDAKGATKEQLLTSSSKKVDGHRRAISRFSAPPGIAGVAVLSVETKEGEPAALSLYLPKLKRVRKIAKSQRGDSFMDTELNFADVGGTTADETKYERLEDAKVDGRDAYVLRGRAGEDSPYGLVTVSIDKKTFVPLKVEYQDKEGKPFKVYRALKLKAFKDRVLAATAVMENLATGAKTTLELLSVDDVALGDEAFSERALERG